MQQQQLQIGSIVLYEDNSAPILAVVRGTKLDRVLLLNEKGREVSLPKNRLFHIETPRSLSNATDRLVELKNEATKIIKTISAAEIWQKSEQEKEYDETELAAVAGLDNTPATILALRSAILNDRVYFQRQKDTFKPRDAVHVEALKKEAKQKHDKEMLAEQFILWCKKRSLDHALQATDEFKHFITVLEDCAAQGAELDGRIEREGKFLLNSLVSILSLNPELALNRLAYNALIKIGHFSRATNLSVIRHRPKQGWSSAEIEEAKDLSLVEVSHSASRLDLTALRTVTIDDATTTDMDDAFSIDGKTLIIHISDVASLITGDSILDRAARERATSIYAPEITIPMLPETVSEDVASLKRSTERPCVSAFFKFDDNFSITLVKIEQTLIKVSDRLTYEEADTLLENEESMLLTLYNIAASHEEKRIEAGAARVEKRDLYVYPDKDNGYRLVEVDEVAPSRLLVSEMMIIYNASVAEFLRKRNLPIPYRSQEAPEDLSSPRVPQGPAYDFALKTRLKRSATTSYPLHHYTLGLPAYTQATSPIRRYLDLVVQRQLLAPIYSKDDIEKLISTVDGPLARATATMRESKRFWILKYLEDRAKTNKTITGTVVKIDPRSVLIELDEVYITTLTRLDTFKREPKLGDSVRLQIVRVTPHENYLKVEEQTGTLP